MDIEKAFTHAGKFHADDVFSTALLRIMNPDIIIERGNQVPEGYDGLVFDIGCGEFDHHQADSPVRENHIPYASFGLLWRKFGQEILMEDAEDFEKNFVEAIDASDNGGVRDRLSDIISDFNSQWDLPEKQDEQFEKAVTFAEVILKNKFRVYISRKKAKEFVHKAMDDSEYGIVILDQGVPWRNIIQEAGFYYVIYPSLRGGFNAQCVPVAEDSFENRLSFPEEWRGLSGKELEESSGVKGLTFCHKSGFLLVGKQLEDVKKACILSLHKGDILK
ncbi:MAG: MYG1 family protein [Lachnospiraceae bacterium]